MLVTVKLTTFRKAFFIPTDSKVENVFLNVILSGSAIHLLMANLTSIPQKNYKYPYTVADIALHNPVKIMLPNYR